MTKLSTPQLRDLISGWLSKPEIRSELKHHSDVDPSRTVKGWGGRPDMTSLEYTVDLFGAPKGCTAVQLEEHIWKLWCDGTQWKRQEKRQLKDEWDYKLTTTEYTGEWKPGLPGNQQEHRIVPYFDVDMLGDFDEGLVAKYANDPKQAAKCIFRCFIPGNQLADNYRLEVLTTPEDDAVIGWTVIVD